MRRELLMSPLGLPCSPPPWGKLVAIDMREGEILWEQPVGTTRDATPLPIALKLGMPNLGGPLVTASGLIFLAATHDDTFRAFDIKTGAELWHVRLPAGGQATPMTYRHGGRQYVVLAAGGHGRAGTTRGDSLLAWALPD
jgi:quinoprotein glucose dehydrogenase